MTDQTQTQTDDQTQITLPERLQRAQALGTLKAAIMDRGITHSDLATYCKKGQSTIDRIMIGNYPKYAQAYLPKYLAEALEAMGFNVPEALTQE